MDWKLIQTVANYPAVPLRSRGPTGASRARKTGRRISRHLYLQPLRLGATEKELFDLGRESATVNAHSARGLQLKATESQQTREIAGGQAVLALPPPKPIGASLVEKPTHR